MNARESRIHILNLQDEHCHNCQFRREQSPKYCVEQCTIGSEMYRLGTALVSCKEKTKEYQTEKLGRVTTTNYSNAEGERTAV